MEETRPTHGQLCAQNRAKNEMNRIDSSAKRTEEESELACEVKQAGSEPRHTIEEHLRPALGSKALRGAESLGSPRRQILDDLCCRHSRWLQNFTATKATPRKTPPLLIFQMEVASCHTALSCDGLEVSKPETLTTRLGAGSHTTFAPWL